MECLLPRTLQLLEIRGGPSHYVATLQLKAKIPTVSIPLTAPEDRSTFATKKHLTLPGPDDIPHSAPFLISRLGGCLKRSQFSNRPPRHSELQRNAASQVRSDAGVS